MADKIALQNMFQKARELIATARETYPKADESAVLIVCDTTIKMAMKPMRREGKK